MDNLCLSPAGHGLSGYAAPTMPHPKLPTELRDERRNRIRQLGIRRRRTVPKHFVDVPLFLSTVQYQSDNLGHVLYRVGAQQSLMREAWASSNNLRLPRGATADDFVVAYVVIPNAVATFGERSSIRHFYQAFNQSWLSVMTSESATSTNINVIEDEEICFRKAWIGQDALYMYHSVGTSPPMRKRYLQSAMGSQKKVQSYFNFLRGRLQVCMLDPLLTWLASPGPVPESSQRHLSMLQGWAQPLSAQLGPAGGVRPIQVLVLQRRNRRLGNLNKLLAALAGAYGVVPRAGAVNASAFELVDSRFSRRPIVVTVVDVQDLPTAHQVALFAATDILVGVHGTAFQWMMMMRRSSVVVELQYPGLGCVSSGVQGDGGSAHCRLFCEFGKTSIAAQLTHVARKTSDLFGEGHPTKFNIIIDVPVFLALFETALCSLQAGVQRSTQVCSSFYPK